MVFAPTFSETCDTDNSSPITAILGTLNLSQLLGFRTDPNPNSKTLPPTSIHPMFRAELREREIQSVRLRPRRTGSR